MNFNAVSGHKSAAEWQREFDSVFAAPVRPAEEPGESLILIQSSQEAFAVRRSDIAGLVKLPSITPLPGRPPALLGIIAVRGIIFPAYDLAALMGLPANPAGHAWVLFAKCETPVGLVFDRFEGQVEVNRACLHVSTIPGSARYVRQVVELGSAKRALIDVPGLVDELRNRAANFKKE